MRAGCAAEPVQERFDERETFRCLRDNPFERTTFFAGVHKGFAPPRVEDIVNNTTGLYVELAPGSAVRLRFLATVLPTRPTSLGYSHPIGLDIRLEQVFVGSMLADELNTETPTANGQAGRIAEYALYNAAINYTYEPCGAHCSSLRRTSQRRCTLPTARGAFCRVRPACSRLV